MANEIFCFDADAIINLFKEYDPSLAMFDKLWKRMDSLIARRRFVSSREVYKELADPEIDAWKKKNKDIFLVAHEHFVLVKEILARFVQLDDPDKEIAHADPFLVAIALSNLRKKGKPGAAWNPMIIVTDEARSKTKSPRKIPYVADQYGIQCLSLVQFFKAVDW